MNRIVRRAAARAAIVVPCALALSWHASFAASNADLPRAADSIEMRDDWDRIVRVPAAARRIVSLAPHATELLFSAGAGSRLVAVDAHSDYPQAARALARVASFPTPDRERLLALRPDLVVLWGAAASRDLVARLESLGLRVFVSEPRTLAAIADSVERFATLAPDAAAGVANAAAFRARVDALRARHANRVLVPVFVQAWAKPLLTLSDRDTIGDALRVCGARNVYADAPLAAPQVSAEAVLAASPRLIVALDAGADRSSWDALGAIAPAGRIAFARVDATIQRPTLRIVGAVAQLCAAVDALR